MNRILLFNILVILSLVSEFSLAEQPKFTNTEISKGKNGKTLQKHKLLRTGKSTTPLQKYKKHMPYHFTNLIKGKKGGKAVEVVQKMIEMEKANRLLLCFQYFGTTRCSSRIANPRPFFIWQRKISHKLTENPAKDVIGILKNSLLQRV